jgi:hypothetical protein
LERKHAYIVLVGAILCLLVSFVVADIGTFDINRITKKPERLESSLRQIAESYASGDDVIDLAEQQGIYVKDEKLRIIIELEQEDTPLPEGYNIEVEGRHGSLVQAMIPIDKLDELTEAPGVKYIRAPKKPLAD